MVKGAGGWGRPEGCEGVCVVQEGEWEEPTCYFTPQYYYDFYFACNDASLKNLPPIGDGCLRDFFVPDGYLFG